MRSRWLPIGLALASVALFPSLAQHRTIRPPILVPPATQVVPVPGHLTPIEIPALKAAVGYVRDGEGIPHIAARNEHDAYLVAGYVQASDRLFQMDLARRQASGTLAELLGPPALSSDVELRTLGLRRASERSLAALSPETVAALEAFAEGVNAYVSTHPLPLEYTLLEITVFEPWTALDCVTIGKAAAFSLSFDLDIAPTQALMMYVQTGAAAGFDGKALFFADLYRAAPFDAVATVPLAESPGAPLAASQGRTSTPAIGSPAVSPQALELAAGYLKRVENIPLLDAALHPSNRDKGSNEWGVLGRVTKSGRPLLANDPHLGLQTPPVFYQLHLSVARTGFDAIGNAFPGTPLLAQGQNRFISWGSTVDPLDVTDTFQEAIVPDPTSPSGLSTIYLGQPEHVIPIPEVFRYNVPGDQVPDDLVVATPGSVIGDVTIPPVTLIVPRRNQGPIIALGTGTALSVQYTGFSATREVQAILEMNHARNLDEFIAGLQHFDLGSQNWAYADVDGHVAYLTSSELPLREDLQAMTVTGLPPAFIRNGTGGNEWIPDPNPAPDQAIPYRILPWAEMPKVIDPPHGWFVNANQDPVGNTFDNDPYNQLRPAGGIFYLNHWYDYGQRAYRIATELEAKSALHPLTPDDMKAIQHNVMLRDAEVFTPYLLAAFAHAAAPDAHPDLVALAGDPRVADAIARLGAWDFTTPTGVPTGYDWFDAPGRPQPPTRPQVKASVAATIYSTWRGQFIRQAIDAALTPYALQGPPGQFAMTALRNLVETFDQAGGVGASGITFFPVAGITDPGTRRDIVMLRSLRDALDLLAGDAFAAAFHHSATPDDWRWGRLHRIVLPHVLGGPFNSPPAAGAFPGSFTDLDGYAVDGGLGCVDASNHDVRAASSNEFMFGSGPARRYVGELGPKPGTIRAETVLPGGENGEIGSPFHVNLLPLWLTNAYYPVRQLSSDRQLVISEVGVFVPAESPGPPATTPRRGH